MWRLTAVLVTLFTISLVFPAGAQHRIGIIGGLNLAGANVEVEEQSADVSSRTLFGIGGVIDFSLSRTFSLRLEPMYLQKGVGKTELAIQPGVEWRAKSSWLELPLFLKAEFGQTFRPYVMAGPTIGILLNSDVEARLSGVTFKGDAKDATESVDVAAAFGAGIGYPIGNSSFFLEGRYSLGLTNTIQGGTFDISAGSVVEEIQWNGDTDTLKNRGFQVMAGITFVLGR